MQKMKLLNFKSWFYALSIVILGLNGVSCSFLSYPYVGAPRTSDPVELIEIARLRMDYGRPIGARTALQKALDESNNGQDLDKYTLARIYTGLGTTYLGMKNIALEEDYYRKSLEISEKLGYQAISIDNYYNLADVYFRKKDNATACVYLSKVRNHYKNLEMEPRDPPFGYGKNGSEFLESFLKPKVKDFSAQLQCDFSV